jgi:hypothetical protein
MSNCIVPGRDGAAARISSFREAVSVTSPPLDSVEIWLTPSIDQDLEQRGVFPELRRTRASAVRAASGWCLHFIAINQAELVLADCIQRVTEVPGGLLNAYHGHERRLQATIKDAKERQALFRASAPRRVRAYDDRECWIGTSAQFKTMGIVTVPGESATDTRTKLHTKDSRGFRARVCGSSHLWAGLFEVTITLPRAEREKPASVERAPSLANLAPTPHAYRARQMDALTALATLFRDRMQHDLGYRYAPEAVDEFLSVLAEAHDVLRSGQIIGRSRDQEIQRAAAARAKADQPLQAFLKLVRDCPPESEA